MAGFRMVEPPHLNGITSAEDVGASDIRQVAVRRGVVSSAIVAGDHNVLVFLSDSRAQREAEQPAPSPIGFPPSPYKGLEAFYEEDADRFFGRSAIIDALWGRLRDLHTPPFPGQTATTRLLAIIGPSGSGKSSVARAGLVPEL